MAVDIVYMDFQMVLDKVPYIKISAVRSSWIKVPGDKTDEG